MPKTSMSALALVMLAVATTTYAQDVSVSTETSVSVEPVSSAPPSDEDAASIESGLTADQATNIKQIISEANVPPVAVDFEVSVGVPIPSTVTLSTLPVEVTSLVPGLSGYLFFVLADGRIVLVSANTLKVVLVI
jgi:hypothetical protein